MLEKLQKVMFLAGDNYVFEYIATHVKNVRHMRSVCMTLCLPIKVLLLLVQHRV